MGFWLFIVLAIGMAALGVAHLRRRPMMSLPCGAASLGSLYMVFTVVGAPFA